MQAAYPRVSQDSSYSLDSFDSWSKSESWQKGSLKSQSVVESLDDYGFPRAVPRGSGLRSRTAERKP